MKLYWLITFLLIISVHSFGINYKTSVAVEDLPEEYAKLIKKGDYEFTALSENKKTELLEQLVKIESKYPASFIDTTIFQFYVLDRIIRYGVECGGTTDYENGIIFLTYGQLNDSLNKFYFERAFHHELSHILIPKFLEKIRPDFYGEWYNLTAVKYGNSGYKALKNGFSGQEFDAELGQYGILYEYAISSFDEDFASFAESLFMNNQDFWKFCEAYEPIRKKKDLAIEFYQFIYSGFSEEFFISIK